MKMIETSVRQEKLKSETESKASGELTTNAFGQSCFGQRSALIWRVPILIWAVTITIWSCASFWGTSDKYLLYMTHWGLLFILMESMFGIVVAVKKYYGDCNDATFGLPWYVRVYWVLYNITIPVAFLITVFYWCILKRSGKKVNYAPNSVLDVMLHGVNSVVMLVELVCSAHPSRLLHIMQPLFFAGVYLLFSVFYYLAGGTDPWGHHFVYPVIDWSKPDKTVVVVALTALFLALMHLVTVAVAAFRDFLARRLNKDTTGLYNEGFAV